MILTILLSPPNMSLLINSTKHFKRITSIVLQNYKIWNLLLVRFGMNLFDHCYTFKISIIFLVHFFFFEENIIKRGIDRAHKKSTIQVIVNNIRQPQTKNRISRDMVLFKGIGAILINKNNTRKHFTSNDEVARPCSPFSSKPYDFTNHVWNFHKISWLVI